MWCIIWWSLGPINGSSGRGSTVSGERAGLGLRQRSPSRAAARPRHRTLEKSALAAGFEEEPGALLGFIGPVVDQAVGRVILCLPGGFLCGAQRFDKLQIVLTQFSEHVLRRHIFSVIVLDGLTPRYVANGPKRRVAGLADSLSDEISRGQNLRSMIIQHQVI